MCSVARPLSEDKIMPEYVDLENYAESHESDDPLFSDEGEPLTFS